MRNPEGVTLHVTPADFEVNPDDAGRLLGPTLWILGAPHHLFGLEVKTDEDGLQNVANPDHAEEFETLQNIWAGAYATVRVGGREFVLYVTPHAD